MFSKACTYGIRAVIYIATQSLDGKRIKIQDVATYSGSPEAFTAKILGKLNKAEIINSYKGPHGGFEMDTQKIQSTKLEEIVYAIDGDSIYNGCALSLSECDASDPCPMHDKFFQIREELKDMLGTTTVFELAFGLKSGKLTLLR